MQLSSDGLGYCSGGGARAKAEGDLEVQGARKR